jgi:hypothetical protein
VEYNRRFFPRSQRQLRVIEFQNLVQGNKTLEQYSAKFMELARFAANLMKNQRWNDSKMVSIHASRRG